MRTSRRSRRRFARRSFELIALAACGLAATMPAAARPRERRLARVGTWAFAIGDGGLNGNLTRRYAGYDLVVLDGEAARRRQVSALRHAGKLVLAYLDVGTIEPYRSWYPLLRPYRRDYWRDWGEWYADLAAPGYRRAIARIIAPRLLAKGFDGLFLDNTDMVETHPALRRGMDALVRGLSAEVHATRRYLFTQNGESSIGPVLRFYDGWNREDLTSTYDFATRRYILQPRAEVRDGERALRRIAAAGLLVLATDYTPGGRAGARVTARAVANACAAGALPFVSDIDLRRVPARPANC